MPEMRNFVVTQTRQVKVTANYIEDAVRIAEAAFYEGQMKTEPSLNAGSGPEGVWGNTTSYIREIAIECKEGR